MSRPCCPALYHNCQTNEQSCSGFVGDLTALETDSAFTGPTFIMAMVVMHLILGMFINSLSMLVMTVPFVFPVIKSFGIAPIWLSIILT